MLPEPVTIIIWRSAPRLEGRKEARQGCRFGSDGGAVHLLLALSMGDSGLPGST
jgi:hypothetical protein